MVSFDPSGIQQMSFGFTEWMHGDLALYFDRQSAIINCLAYDHLWHGLGSNDAGCWDAITQANLDETSDVMLDALERLQALASRINALQV